jgi:hypothetical protein
LFCTVARVLQPVFTAKEAARDPQVDPTLLGLAVGTPDTGALPGRIRPSFEFTPRSTSDWSFDFHGFLNVPLRAGINERLNPTQYQYKTVLHAPPLVPDDFDRFEHTGVISQPWVQLGFSYGNSRVVANVIIAASTVSNGSGYFNPPDHIGINDAFITFKLLTGRIKLEADVGGFANRYGALGEYDTGRYETPVIARVGGVGETLRLVAPLGGPFSFVAEHGVMGQLDRVPLGVEPAGWNGFADPNVGSSFANHAHVGIAMKGRGQLGLHYVSAFTQDDRTAPTSRDGNIMVLGADASLRLTPFGRLGLATAWTKATDSRTVSGVVRVLNTFGGPGLMLNYFGPNSGGTGTLTTMGAQYDVSIGEIVRGRKFFSGYAPDVMVSLFGMYTHVTSADKDPAYFRVDKLKYGTEVAYSMLSWLALTVRYDRVVADTKDDSKTFGVISPRVILRTDYNAKNQVTLQYSRWFDGSGVVVRNGYPPTADPSLVPDSNVVSLTGSMWW